MLQPTKPAAIVTTIDCIHVQFTTPTNFITFSNISFLLSEQMSMGRYM